MTTLELVLQRYPTTKSWTFGEIFVEDVFECYTLEDELREVKIHGETCIPAGTYEVILEDSPKFGADCMTLKDVLDFIKIRIHGGNNEHQTDGCVIVGDLINHQTGIISGAKVRGVLDRLRNKVRGAISRGARVYMTIKNAPGDKYVDSGRVAG